MVKNRINSENVKDDHFGKIEEIKGKSIKWLKNHDT